jgi:hypothetical protein
MIYSEYPCRVYIQTYVQGYHTLPNKFEGHKIQFQFTITNQLPPWPMQDCFLIGEIRYGSKLAVLYIYIQIYILISLKYIKL